MQHALNCAWICHRSRARRQSAHGNGLTVAMLRWSEIGVDDVVVEVGVPKGGDRGPRSVRSAFSCGSEYAGV